MKIFEIAKPLHANPPESKVWFKLRFEEGCLVGLEEHDGYSGGEIKPRNGEDFETLFFRRVEYRGGDAVLAIAALMAGD